MTKFRITVLLDKEQLTRTKKLLRARTATETIERALSLVERSAHDAIVLKYSALARKSPSRIDNLSPSE